MPRRAKRKAVLDLALPAGATQPCTSPSSNKWYCQDLGDTRPCSIALPGSKPSVAPTSLFYSNADCMVRPPTTARNSIQLYGCHRSPRLRLNPARCRSCCGPSQLSRLASASCSPRNTNIVPRRTAARRVHPIVVRTPRRPHRIASADAAENWSASGKIESASPIAGGPEAKLGRTQSNRAECGQTQRDSARNELRLARTEPLLAEQSPIVAEPSPVLPKPNTKSLEPSLDFVETSPTLPALKSG